MAKVDFYLQDLTHASHWPGLLPYRDKSSKRGYKTAREAYARATYINKQYAGKTGSGGPDLRVVQRTQNRVLHLNGEWCPVTVCTEV